MEGETFLDVIRQFLGVAATAFRQDDLVNADPAGGVGSQGGEVTEDLVARHVLDARV